MAPRRTLSPSPAFDESLLLKAFEEANVKELHAVKLWGHAIRKPNEDISSIPDLPRAALQLFEGESPKFVKMTSRVVQCEKSSDGLTTKLKVELQDRLAVETVIMRWDPDATSPALQRRDSTEGDDDDSVSISVGVGRNASDRATVGCQMGCTFCATGTMGLVGNLTAGEIVEQLMHAREHARIRNVVFMGMGEPMNNWAAVTSAIRIMVDPRLFGIAPRHVTVSTVGVIPRIRSMAADLPGISLALSLHAPNQELRQSIVPSAKAYPLDRLMHAVDEYQLATKQKVFVEYVVLKGVNDRLEQAHELGSLLKGRNVTLNLIPWNPVYSAASASMGFEAPSQNALDEFLSVLRGPEYGIFSTVRQEKGQDISGACGQLVIQSSGVAKVREGGGCPGGLRDIEELAG